MIAPASSRPLFSTKTKPCFNMLENKCLKDWAKTKQKMQKHFTGYPLFAPSAKYQYNISNSLLVSVYSYGDRFPLSVGGRLFAVLWILVGICVCSIFTAALTSSLTTLSMETKIALPGTKVLFHSMDKKHSKLRGCCCTTALETRGSQIG